MQPFSLTRPVTAASLVASLAVLAVISLLAGPAGGRTADAPELVPDQRVYDLTGRSLDGDGEAAVAAALDEVVAAGGDPVVVVRELDASPEETLDQVEALQGRWARATGGARDTAVALLVNRNADDDTDARAGLFVGARFDDGNVPRDEQEDIVTEELIPPLRDGDVAAGLVAALDRLASSIRSGPPQSDFERFAERVAAGWLPWALAVVALAGAWVLAGLARRRGRIDATTPPPSTTRPGDLPPAVGGALAHGGPRPSAVTATLLDLARRGAVLLLPEDAGEGAFDEPSVALRLWSREVVADPVGRALYDELATRAEDGRVAGEDLRDIARSSDVVADAVSDQLEAPGWLDEDAPGRAGRAGLLAAAGLVVAVAGLVLVAASQDPWPLLLGTVLAGVVGVGGIVVAATTPRLSQDGQRAALPWEAYRDGLAEAASQEPPALDLAATLPDLVAHEVADRCHDHLTDDASALADYVGTEDPDTAAALATFPWWSAVVTTTAPPSAGAGAGAVTAAGAAGGGGAAAST